MAQSKRSKKADEPKRRRQNDTIADWGSCNPELLAAVVSAITQGDGAVRFGYSRDGGAYSIGVYGDGKPFTEYLPGTADVDDWLEGFKQDFE